MAWYNNWGDLTGDIKSIVTGHNPSNKPPPRAIPLGPTSSGPTIPGKVPTGQTGYGSTQPVLPNIPGVPGTDSGGGDSGGGIDWGSFISKIPGWVLDGLKIGLPAAVEWIKNNGDTILQGAGVAEAAYRAMQADKYAKQALSGAQDAYNAKAPLRAAGIAGMQAPTGNPFSTNQLGGLPLAKPGAPPATPPTALPIAPGTPGIPPRLLPFLPHPPGTPQTPPMMPPRLAPFAPKLPQG